MTQESTQEIDSKAKRGEKAQTPEKESICISIQHTGPIGNEQSREDAGLGVLTSFSGADLKKKVPIIPTKRDKKYIITSRDRGKIEKKKGNIILKKGARRERKSAVVRNPTALTQPQKKE